jgi:hypothetical protein
MKQLLSATGLLCLLIATISLLDSCKKQDDLFLNALPVDSVRNTILDTINKQKRRALDSVLGLLPIIPTPTIIPTPIPVGGSTSDKPDSSTVCQVQKYKWAPGNEETMLLDPTAEVIFPCGLLKAESITDGTYIPIIAPRRPMIISTSLTNVKGSPIDTVFDPARKSSVQEALNRLFSRELDGNFPAKMTKDVQRIYTEDQASIAVGANYGGYGATVSGKFDWSNKKIKQRYMVRFYQEFFSVSVDIPERPSDMFSAVPNPKLIGSYSPVYVSNMKYGRVVLFLWETESDDTNIGAELHASYGGFGQSGGVDVVAKFRSLMQKATMKIFAVGGDAAKAAKVNSPETLKTFIEEGANYSKASQGLPIAYTLRFLKDNSVAKVVQSAEYSVRSCENIPDRIYELGSAGGTGGDAFEFTIPSGAKLLSVQANAGDKVDGLTFRYLLSNGTIESKHFGGDGGNFQPTATLSDNLRLTGISGRYGRVIDKIKFHFSDGTSSQDYGGGGGDNDFSFQVQKNGDQIIGFFGRSGRLIDALGVVCKGK